MAVSTPFRCQTVFGLGWFSQGHFLSITTLVAGSAQTDLGCCRLPGLVLIKFPGMLVKREAAVLGIILLNNTAHTKQLNAGFQQGPGVWLNFPTS